MTFDRAVADYTNFVFQKHDAKIDRLRAEIHVESMKDWSRLGDYEAFREWFLAQREKCSMQVEDIPLEACEKWTMDSESGRFVHDSGEFFYVQGVRVTNVGQREVGTGWDQPILTQVGYEGGILGILRQKRDGVPHYLLEAKAEPGNYEMLQLSPTVQATYSNLKGAHGGRAVTMADYFQSPEDNGVTVLYDNWMSEDGGRLHLKRNKGMLVEIREQIQLDVGPSFTWLSMWQIKQAITENAWVGPHVRSIISHL